MGLFNNKPKLSYDVSHGKAFIKKYIRFLSFRKEGIFLVTERATCTKFGFVGSSAKGFALSPTYSVSGRRMSPAPGQVVGPVRDQQPALAALTEQRRPSCSLDAVCHLVHNNFIVIVTLSRAVFSRDPL